MISLNNSFKLLFLLIFVSCTNLDSDLNDPNEGGYFKNRNINTSPLESYEIDFKVSEKFTVDNNIVGMNISHKALPIPSVVRVYNPNDLTFNLVVRNIESTNQKRLAISSEIENILQVDTNVYIEYLKEESIVLRNVDQSKELSKVKLDSTDISFEDLDSSPEVLSSKLDYEKIEEIESTREKYEGLILVDKYTDLATAKIQTNKIRNLSLNFENTNENIYVFAGPFKDNDISLKLDFLKRNGYLNAKLYP